MTYGRYDQKSLGVSQQIMMMIDRLPYLSGGRCQLQAKIQIAINDALESRESDTEQHASEMSRKYQDERRDRDYWKQRAEKAEEWNRQMVEKAAAGHTIDGYRELAQRLEQAERQCRELEHREKRSHEVLTNHVEKLRAAEQRRDELAAYIEGFKALMDGVIEPGKEWAPEWDNEMADYLEKAPDTTLTDHDIVLLQSRARGFRKIEEQARQANNDAEAAGWERAAISLELDADRIRENNA